MKIFGLIEHKPATGRIKRGRMRLALESRGFVSLPGTLSGWVADHRFSSVEEAKEAVTQAATKANVQLHKAYLIEYGSFAVLP